MQTLPGPHEFGKATRVAHPSSVHLQTVTRALLPSGCIQIEEKLHGLPLRADHCAPQDGPWYD
jgi:hypothetical protein